MAKRTSIFELREALSSAVSLICKMHGIGKAVHKFSMHSANNSEMRDYDQYFDGVFICLKDQLFIKCGCKTHLYRIKYSRQRTTFLESPVTEYEGSICAVKISQLNGREIISATRGCMEILRDNLINIQSVLNEIRPFLPVSG